MLLMHLNMNKELRMAYGDQRRFIANSQTLYAKPHSICLN